MVKKLLCLIIIAAAIFICHNQQGQSEESQSISIASFNIQFLGHFKKKDNKALASILKDYDIVVVQELVAPPVVGMYPDGSPYKADNESAGFFNEMSGHGFDYVLSEEDTGTGDVIHKASSATEWWATFYKPNIVNVAEDIPSGFLANDRSNHDMFERVPYAFAFRTNNNTMDFVLISVHLNPGASKTDRNRRKEELVAIEQWIDDNDEKEKDFIILGDMNIEDAEELVEVTPDGYISLNNEMRRTNTLINPTIRMTEQSHMIM